MADVDKDGLLDADEFALAMHLINIKVDGDYHSLLLYWIVLTFYLKDMRTFHLSSSDSYDNLYMPWIF